ncbi:unnamed protein product [Effrenium voratum]|nr:unnamed protein product [Effrenium voratum]
MPTGLNWCPAVTHLTSTSNSVSRRLAAAICTVTAGPRREVTMRFSQAPRGSTASFLQDGKAAGIVRQPKGERKEPLTNLKPASRAEYERSLKVFKCTADVDAGNGRKLRRPQQPLDKTLIGAPTGSVQSTTFGLPERRLRGMTKHSCTEESNEDLMSRREFFDHCTRADDYADLLGRPMLSPRKKECSILEGAYYLAEEKDGDFEDLSTAASDDCETRHSSVPSLRVRRVLQSLMPVKGGPDIPLEMVARLEHLVELADRVETKKRNKNHMMREYSPGVSILPDDLSVAESETLPMPEEEEDEEALEERPSVQQLVQKYEAPISQAPGPTLLRRGNPQGVKPSEGESSDALPEKYTDKDACAENGRWSAEELVDKTNALRRKGFNLFAAGGESWDQLHAITAI